MNGLRFALTLAWRETRGSRRTLLLLVSAVAVGVAALVAIRSFADAARDAVRGQARALLGADLVASGARPFSEAAEAALAGLARDAARRGPVGLARVTSFGAMAYVDGRPGSRLVQVMAVETGYPFYGEVETEPAGRWGGFHGGALVDDALLVALDARAGETLALGEARLPIRAAVRGFPGDIGVRASLGPRVFVALEDVDRTGLLAFGSRARYTAYLRLPAGADPERLVEQHRPRLAAERLSLRTVAEDERRIDENLGRLGRYLGLVGLIALLLGGIGVASAVHLLVRRRLAMIAVLRCLGASSRQVLGVHLAQALGLGLLGSTLGAALGAALQALLPAVLGDFLPVAVASRPSWPAIASGLLTGATASVLFALPPLVAVRRVPPLLALRRDVEQWPAAGGHERRLALLALALGVAGLASVEAGSLRTGAAFALGLLAALGALGAAAAALMALLRRAVSPRLPYPLRQGLANLHRPANQTLAVVLALGLGAFLLATLIVVQHNLLRDLRSGQGPRVNLALFDVQPDQVEGVLEELRAAGASVSAPVPIVPMRLLSVKGVPVAQKLAQAAAGAPIRAPAWLLRREFRSTYRAEQTASERLVAGAWWSGDLEPEAAVPVSLEADVARDLEVAVGDEIVWDVQGVPFASRVASLRTVEWARFEPNFFAVFPKGPLDRAPQTLVALARIEDRDARARLLRALVERFPNLSALDLFDVQRTIEGLLARIAWAVRFLALFSVASGGLVLLGAVMASRLERLREAVLLKTLGATRRQVAQVVASEYACLGLVSACSGVLLASAAGWALTRYLFETRFALPALPLFGFGLGVALLTLVLGGSGSLEVFRRTSLELLRNE